MKYLSALALLATITSAHAQAAPQQASPHEQALSDKLLNEINGALMCSTSLISMRGDIAAKSKQLDDLDKQANELKKNIEDLNGQVVRLTKERDDALGAAKSAK
jgi:peptidoglycan hydrolase CwlO-like protein